MAVALATLPLKSLADGDGETLLAISTGAGLSTGLADADLAGPLSGAALIGAGLTETALTGAALTGAALGGVGCLTADAAAGFATGLAGVAAFFVTGVADGFFNAVLFTATFFTAIFLTATCLTAGVLAGAFFVTTFFTADFFAAGFAAGFFAGLAFFTGDLATVFVVGLTAFLTTAVLPGFALAAALAFFAGILLALFTVRPFVAAAFDLPVLTSFALTEGFPFCALAAVELRVVFAISLHQFSAVTAGCYSPRVLHQQAYFWNTCTTTCCRLFRRRECCEPIDTVVAAFLQALAQSPVGATMPFSPQLFRLCTDCGDTLRSVARQPPRRLAVATLSAPVQRRRRPGARAFPLSALSRSERITRCPMTG